MASFSFIKNIAQETIRVEAAALQELIDTIDDHFIEIVQTVMGLKGRLVVTGIGKSAIVCQKIVATLNSTGTPALFMHAADAIHGDLGMICSDDLVLCLSKSGETPEIKALIPLLKNLNIPVIGMTAQATSFLARQATYFWHSPVAKEADPNNLAPTTSTTVQMALGDALATALLAWRGFTPAHFAQFHPGGALGKQLYLKVEDIYKQNELPKVSFDADLKTIILEMTSKRLGATAVVNEEQVLIGVITDGDLRRMLNRSDDLKNIFAKNIMTKNPQTIRHDALAVEALQVMKEKSISQLLVLKNTELVGFIHLHDLIREGII